MLQGVPERIARFLTNLINVIPRLKKMSCAGLPEDHKIGLAQNLTVRGGAIG